MYSDLLYTYQSKIDNNREQVLKFKEASLKGWEYAYSNIEESVDLILSKYNTQKLTKDELLFEAKVLKELSYYETETLGNIDLNKLQRIYDLYNIMGLVKKKVHIKDFVLVENNFTAFLKNVLKNLTRYIELPYIYFFIILFFVLICLIIYKHIKLLENELIQCFINIFNNAKDALVENNQEGDRYIFISQETINTNVIIKFRDNAGGIPNDIIHKVFEPYFTTKHQRQGTGLGLHITYNFIIDSMNGNINVNNVEFNHNGNDYVGVEFIITLPY